MPQLLDKTINILKIKYLRGPSQWTYDPVMEVWIDIGELVAQHLSLALEPYPRRPGVTFAGIDDDADAGSPGVTNPFEVLAKLKGGG